jgi:hypothetical protein
MINGMMLFATYIHEAGPNDDFGRPNDAIQTNFRVFLPSPFQECEVSIVPSHAKTHS